jgi:hypothetical protein
VCLSLEEAGLLNGMLSQAARHPVAAASRRGTMAEEPEIVEGSTTEDESATGMPDESAQGPVVPDELVPDVPTDEEPPKPANRLLAIVVGVLAVALIASAGYFGFTTLSGGASDSRAKVEAALAFTKAMLTQDAAGLKSFIPSDALQKVTNAQWSALESSSSKTAITFDKVTWASESATMKLAAAGQAGEITAKADPRATDTVTMSFSGVAFGETVPGSCVLVREGSSWKVTSFTIGATTLKFDAANISNTMGSETATDSQPATGAP